MFFVEIITTKMKIIYIFPYSLMPIFPLRIQAARWQTRFLIQSEGLYRVAQKTEQSIQSIFQDFALINSYLFHLAG